MDPLLNKYKAVSVFSGKYKELPEEVAVTRNYNVVGNVRLDENEAKVLDNNPKLATLEKLDEELLARELEVAGNKARWEF